MRDRANDTSPEIEALRIEGYRRMSPAEKFRRIEELNEMVLQLAAARLKREHPGIGERELRLRLAALWVEPALLKKAFGWDPERTPR